MALQVIAISREHRQTTQCCWCDRLQVNFPSSKTRKCVFVEMAQVNPVNVVNLVLECVKEICAVKKIRTHSAINEKERELAKHIAEIIVNNCEGMDNISDTLVLTDYFIDEQDAELENDSDSSRQSSPDRETRVVVSAAKAGSSASKRDSDHNYDPKSDRIGRKKDAMGPTFEQKKAAIAFSKTPGGKPKTLKTIQHTYTFVHSMQQLADWKHQIDKGGSREDILMTIRETTFQKFLETTREGIDIHDSDIQIWAAEVSAELANVYPFEASSRWVQKFKKQYGITSRKITAYVSQMSFQDSDKVKQSADNFVRKIKLLMQERNIQSDHVFNFDQSGFNYEMTRNRTLAMRNAKNVIKSVQAKHATTHSYTIMCPLSMSGILGKKMMVVYQEKMGNSDLSFYAIC